MQTDLIYRDTFFFKLIQVSVFLPRFIQFIHFHFQFFERFDHVQTFRLIEINFRFVENVKCSAIT